MATRTAQLTRMVQKNPVCVSPNTTIIDAMVAMEQHHGQASQPGQAAQAKAVATCVLVLEHNTVIGLLTAIDMVSFTAQQRPITQQTIREILSHPPITARESSLTDLSSILDIFEQNSLSHLPILDDQDQLIGLISYPSLLSELKSCMGQQPSSAEQAIDKPEAKPDRGISRAPAEQSPSEQALICKQHHLEALLNNIPHITWIKDEKSRFIAVNQPFAQAGGTTPGALVGKTDFDVWPTELAQAYREDDFEVLKSNQRKVVEEKVERADGTVSWIETTKTPFRDADGNIAGTVGIAADITRRRQIEAALAESEAKFRRLVEGGQELTWSTDTQGQFTYLSPQFKALTGWEISEWLGRKCCELVHPDDRDCVLEAYQTLAQTVAFSTLEFRLICHNRSYIWVCINSTPMFDEAGEWTGRQGILTDITARKTAEFALQDSQAQFHRMTENVPGMIFRYVLHPDGADELTYVSSQIREVFELEPEAALQSANRLWERVHPDDVPWLYEARQLSADTLQPMTKAYRLCLPKKGLRWMRHISHVERLANGDVVWDGIAIDITDRKRQEQEQERLLKIIESTSDYIGFASAEGYILWHNKAFKEFRPDLGTPEDRIHLSVGHPTWAYEMIQTEALPQAIEQGTWSGESMILDAEGNEIPVSQVLIAHKSDEGEVQYFSTIIRDIRDRKAIERQLEFTQYGLDHAADCFYCLDADANIKQVNQAACQHTGYTKEELLGMTLHQLTPTCSKERTWKRHWEKLKRLKSYSFESVQSTKTGEIFPVEVVCNYLEFDGKAYDFEIIRNISARKAAEAQKNQHLAAIEAAANGISILKSDRYLYLNNAHLELSGYTLEELLDQSWHCLYSAEVLEDFKQRVWPVLEQERTWQGEVVATRKDGSCFDQSLSLTRLDNDLLICVFSDISDRKQAEMALEKEILRRDAVFNASPDGIHILDRVGNLMEANSGFAQMLGYSLEEMVGLHVADWDAQWSYEEIKEILKNHTVGKHSTFETLHRRKDGITFPVEVSQCSIEWNGEFALVCISRDISERKKYEIQLQQKNEELARATRLKDEFLANMSHELRTPLNSILGFSEALKDKILGPLNEAQINAVTTIESSGTHLLRLINDILDVAKIESGKIELNKSLASISEICHSSIAFIKQQALKKNIRLTINISQNLPNLLLDERRILQVLINLLDNAVKFTPTEGEIILAANYHEQQLELNEVVLTELAKQDPKAGEVLQPHADTRCRGEVKIEISDTGIGIAPENMRKLFQPFIQIDSSLNRQYAGTGLGLTLVKRIVELHGGIVNLQSEVGVGSSFDIILPCDFSAQETELDLTPRDVKNQQESREVKQEYSPLILLAEDNESNIQVVVNYLQFYSYRLIIAKNGIKAIELAKSRRPNLILMDIQMPQMNGIEAIQEIRQDAQIRNIPIIALTALAMKGDEERLLSAGANAYLSKPVKLKQLKQLIEQLIES